MRQAFSGKLFGMQGITDDQARLQMGAWAIFASPLIMGNDVRNMTATQRAILQNADVIAINQDPAGRLTLLLLDNTSYFSKCLLNDDTHAGQQGRLVRCIGTCRQQQVWVRPLHDGSYAIALFNLEEAPRRVCMGSAELTMVQGPRELQVQITRFLPA